MTILGLFSLSYTLAVPNATLAALTEKRLKSNKFNQSERNWLQLFLASNDFSEANRMGVAYEMVTWKFKIPAQLPAEHTDNDQEFESIRVGWLESHRPTSLEANH